MRGVCEGALRGASGSGAGELGVPEAERGVSQVAWGIQQLMGFIGEVWGSFLPRECVSNFSNRPQALHFVGGGAADFPKAPGFQDLNDVGFRSPTLGFGVYLKVHGKILVT